MDRAAGTKERWHTAYTTGEYSRTVWECLLEKGARRLERRRRIPSGGRLAEGGFASVMGEIGEHLEDESDPRRRARAKRVAVRLAWCKT